MILRSGTATSRRSRRSTTARPSASRDRSPALKKDRDGYFAPGRFVMTCCVEDIAFMGLPCKYADAASLHAREWVTVEATVSVRFHALYRGTGPILTAIRVTPAEPAKNEVATF